MKSVQLFVALVSVALTGSVFGRSQPVAIPEKCVFLTNTINTNGGEYSYIDPLGSLVTISYEIGANGQYTETRKVVNDYASGHGGSGSASTDVNVVINQVIQEIEVQITTTIEQVLISTNVNAPNFRPNNLVEIILKKLRPIITTTVRRIISSSGLNLNINEVVENVIAQIQPSILQGVESAIKGNSDFNNGKNKPGKKPTGSLSGQGENSALLIDQIIAQLRPFIVQTVNQQTKIQCQNHGGSSSGFVSSTGSSFGSSRPSRPSSGSSRPSSGSARPSSSGSASSSGFESRPSSGSNRPSSGSSRPSSGSSRPSSGSSRPSSGSSRPSSGSSRPSSGSTRPSVPLSSSNRPSSGSSRPSSGSSRPSSGSSRPSSGSSRPSSGSSRPSSGSSRPSSGSSRPSSGSSRPSSGSTRPSRPSSGSTRPSRPSYGSNRPSSGSSRPSSGSSRPSSGSSRPNIPSIGSTRPSRPSSGSSRPSSVPTGNINKLTDELVEIIVEMLKSDIQSAVLSEISAHSQNDENVLADAILTTLRPSIVKVITNTVNSNSKFAGFKSDIESLTTKILAKLRPIIIASIKSGLQKVREEQAKQAAVAEGQLIQAVVSQVEGKIEGEVNAELQGYSGSLANANKQSLVNAIINRIRPIILSALKNLQRSDSRFSSLSSSRFDALVEQIVSRLRPLILQFIENALNSIVLEGKLIDAVVSQVEGQIEGEVSAELQGYSGSLANANKQSLVNAIITRIRPIILSALKNLQRSDSRFSSLSSSRFDELVEQIVSRLRPLILQFIENALNSVILEGKLIDAVVSQVEGQIEGEVNAELQGYSGSLANANKQSLVNAIIQRLKPIILSALKNLQRSDSRYSSISSSKFNSLSDQIVDRLRPIILQLIENAIQQFSFQESLIEELISLVLGQLDGEIQNFVTIELNGLSNLNNVNEQSIFRAVINKMTPLIRQTVQTVIRSQSSFSNLSGRIDFIVERIIEALQPIILDAIQFNLDVLREEAAAAAAAAAQKPAPPKQDKITSLFGISGENNVKVETPSFNYQYAIDFAKRR